MADLNFNDRFKAIAEKKIGPVRLAPLLISILFTIAVIIFWQSSDSIKGRYTFNATACVFAVSWIVLRRFSDAVNLAEKILFSLALGSLFVLVLFNNNYKRTVSLYKNTHIRTWNMYHYYIGSKYFDELGYRDLYLQTVLADQEDTNRLGTRPETKIKNRVRRVRDLSDYQVKPLAQVLPETRKGAWTDERWKEFKKDLRVFLPKAARNTWARILTDRGYNPTPFWNTVGNTISSAIDLPAHRAQDQGTLLFAVSIDMLLYLAMIGFVIWAFGTEAAMLAFLAFILMPFNLSRLVGGYVQYDWMAAIVAGICCLKKQRPVASAVFFGFATMARMFPLVLAAGVGLGVVRKILQRFGPALISKIRGVSKKNKSFEKLSLDSLGLDRFHRLFAATFLVVIIICIIIGSFSVYGFGGWLEWKSNIGLHNYEMTFGEGRIGLKHIFIHKLGEDKIWETPKQRKQVLPTQIHYYYLAAAFFFALFLPALWKLKKDVNAVIAMMILFYILFVPSHYYWSILMILPLWLPRIGDGWKPAIIPAATPFIAAGGWFFYSSVKRPALAQYVRLDWILGFCFIALMLSIMIGAYLAKKNAGQPGSTAD